MSASIFLTPEFLTSDCHPPDPKTFYLVFTVESSNFRLEDGITAIQCGYGLDPNTFKCQTWHFHSINDDDDDDPVLNAKLWHEINDFLSDLEIRYQGFSWLIVFSHLNGEMEQLDYHLSKICGRLPVRYSLQGHERRMVNVYDQMRFFPYLESLRNYVSQKTDKFNNGDEKVLRLLYQQYYLDHYTELSSPS